MPSAAGKRVGRVLAGCSKPEARDKPGLYTCQEILGLAGIPCQISLNSDAHSRTRIRRNLHEKVTLKQKMRTRDLGENTRIPEIIGSRSEPSRSSLIPPSDSMPPVSRFRAYLAKPVKTRDLGIRNDLPGLLPRTP